MAMRRPGNPVILVASGKRGSGERRPGSPSLDRQGGYASNRRSGYTSEVSVAQKSCYTYPPVKVPPLPNMRVNEDQRRVHVPREGSPWRRGRNLALDGRGKRNVRPEDGIYLIVAPGTLGNGDILGAPLALMVGGLVGYRLMRCKLTASNETVG